MTFCFCYPARRLSLCSALPQCVITRYFSNLVSARQLPLWACLYMHPFLEQWSSYCLKFNRSVSNRNSEKAVFTSTPYMYGVFWNSTVEDNIIRLENNLIRSYSLFIRSLFHSCRPSRYCKTAWWRWERKNGWRRHDIWRLPRIS